ncbi:hypothetical protein [Zobellia sp. 1_MG-2023]|uniref:hypothetical protein n=1 Tax=Zobellia sp. 1_MG-2023 TaxID=3062626 RepID=UPI0026E159A5|nr:hypothetical protein [Zobellia sp. 1_MG-2023]MDO6818315.1 hypothetical protein [Zobellia sp. 1_MG-2023]
MKNILLLITVICLNVKMFAQNCPKPNISKELEIKISTDSIYKQDVQFRMEYYVKLSKMILPKYFGLKKLIKQKIEVEDRAKIEELAKSYEKNRLEYLDEFKKTNASVYQNALGYSNLNTLLIFETLSVFPDTYAILLNETIPKSRAKAEDKILIDQLYSKYNGIMIRNSDCIRDMAMDIKTAKNQFKILEIFQNTGNRTEEDNAKIELINLLIWAEK